MQGMLSDTALWRAGRRWLWAGGFGLLLSGSSAFGADCVDAACAAPAGCVTGTCDAGCGPDCCDIYAQNAAKLRTEYDRLATSATGCGTVCGETCDLGCDGSACGAGCGLFDGMKGLFGGLGGHKDGCDALGCEAAGCDVDSCDGCGEEEPCLNIGGWVQFGYHDGSTGQFNNRPDQFANHQSWVYVEREADGSDGLGLGFRADVMYGLDADDTQAFGNPPGTFDFHPDSPNNFFNRGAYGWAIPQLYAEAAYGDFSVIAGHFYTLLGYEVVTAPDNFFYSHAFTMYNAEAFTHTGVLSTYEAGDNLTLYNGFTFGWDTGFEDFNDGDSSDGANYLGGFSTGLGENATFTYITTVGDLGVIGEGYTHSLVLDVAVTDRLNYVIQSDYFDVDTNQFQPSPANPLIQIPDGESSTQLYGVNQYLFYTINDYLSYGSRYEWFKVDGDSIYNTTYGLNVRPTENLVIRPEYRYQFGDRDGFANIGDGTAEDNEGIFGVDVILTY